LVIFCKEKKERIALHALYAKEGFTHYSKQKGAMSKRAKRKRAKEQIALFKI